LRVKRAWAHVKVEVRAGGEGLASHAGAGLIGETADHLGLTSAPDRALEGLFERTPTHSPARVIRDLAVMLAGGGDALCDLGSVRDQEALFGLVASDATAYRLIERIGLLHVSCGSCGHGAGIELAGDEVDHRDVVAVGAVPAGSPLGGLDE
jgi:hypothetical protein